MNIELKLIKDLQAEFLKDPDNVLDDYREALMNLQGNSIESIHRVWKIMHTLKGTAQVVGFLYFAEFINEFEDSLTIVEEKIKSQGRLSEVVQVKLEQLLANMLRAIEDYFDILSKSENDEDNFRMTFSPIAKALANWDPLNADVSNDWGMMPPVVIDSFSEVDVLNVDSYMREKIEVDKKFQQEKTEPEVISDDKQKLIPIQESLPPQADLQTQYVPPAQVAAQTQVKIATSQPMQQTKNVVKNTKKEYLLLKSMERYYAIPMHQVQEILENRVCSPLPIKIRNILGVMNLAGEVLTIVDFCQAVGIQDNDQNRGNTLPNKRCIVVCAVDGKRFGFQIDKVEQIVEIKPDMLQNTSDSELHIHGKAISQLALLNEKPILIVDVRKIV